MLIAFYSQDNQSALLPVLYKCGVKVVLPIHAHLHWSGWGDAEKIENKVKELCRCSCFGIDENISAQNFVSMI